MPVIHNGGHAIKATLHEWRLWSPNRSMLHYQLGSPFNGELDRHRNNEDLLYKEKGYPFKSRDRRNAYIPSKWPVSGVGGSGSRHAG